MKTYWDYSEKERSEMTEEGVKALLDVELMSKGVLKVVAPELKTVTEVKLNTVTWYEVDGIVFESVERAKAFIELKPSKLKSEYIGGGWGNAVKYPQPIAPRIDQELLIPYEEILANRSALTANKEAKDHNAKVTEEYKKASDAQEKILGGVWADWWECREKSQKHQKVMDTRAQYLKMADGNQTMADQFLGKVFCLSEINKALEWFGQPLLTEADVPAPAPAKVEEKEKEEVAL